jgi:eukaryotic-like serine/threonine-protein kinase
LIAAKHPFRGDNDMITLRRICDNDPAPELASVVPNCPPALNALVAKALAKDVDERFASMQEFARGIDRAIAELKLQGLPDEDVVGFVKGMLGERAEKRRAAIREGIKTADERAEQRQQEQAQQAAVLAQLRASGVATPANMPPPLMSIPPPPMGSTSSIPPEQGSTTPSTSSSSLTHKAMVADLDAPASGSGKKKFAVAAFAVVGLGAIAAAVVLGMQSPPAGSANQSPATPATSAATVPAVVTPTAKPTAASVASQQAGPAASASSKSKTSTPTGPRYTPPTKASNDGLPRVRDPGF